MSYRSPVFACLLAALLLVGGSAASVAQQRTSATYQDWIVQCETSTGTPAQKFCDMAQLTQVQGKNIPLSRVSIPRPIKGQPVRLLVQVPVNLWLLTGLRIQISESDPGIVAPFNRCTPGGCFAEFELKDDVLKKFRAATGAGRMLLKEANGQDLAIPVSFKGFDQAFEALGKE